MMDGQSNAKLKELLAQCEETLELTEEEKLWLATPGDAEAKRKKLEELLEDAEDLRLALQALAEGGPAKSSDKLRHDLGLDDAAQSDGEA